MLPFMTQPAVAAPTCYVPRAGSVIAQSQSFRGAQYLTRNFGAGNVNTWTFSVAFQRHAFGVPHYLLGTYIAQAENWLEVGSDDKAFACWRRSGGTSSAYKGGTKVNRDPSGFSRLTFQAENLAANLFHIFDGAAEVTYGSSAVGMTGALNINTARLHYLGSQNGTYGLPQMALAEVYFIDGAALPPETFGEYNIHGVWVPKPKDEIYAAITAAGGFGTNGFHLDFSDPLNPGKDVSGRGNHWTAVGFDSAGKDTWPSSPSRGYATMNPLRSAYGYLDTGGFSNGNLTYKSGVTSNDGLSPYATVPVVPGTVDVRMEVKIDRANAYATAGTRARVGLFGPAGALQLQDNGIAGYSGACVPVSGAAPTLTTGDIVTFAVRPSLGVIEVYKGTVLACTFSLFGLAWANGTVVGASGSDYSQQTWNFGQKPWSVTIPALAGAVGVSTDILPEPDVKDPAEALTQATATGANIVAVLEAGAALWNGQWVEIIKRRDAAEDWRLRFGDDVANALAPNNANAKAATAALTAAGSYVGYRLRVGKRYGVYTAEVIHANGTPTTVTHNLGTARSAVIATRVSAGGGDRYLWHPDMTAGYLGKLNGAAAALAPDGTLTAFGANSFQIAGTAPSGTYRVLVLAERPGLLTLVTSTGNATADGMFAPADILPVLALMIPANAGNRRLWDAARNPTNPASISSAINLPDIDSTAYAVDLVGGGAKLRTADTAVNASGVKYHWLMWGRPVGGVCVAPANAR